MKRIIPALCGFLFILCLSGCGCEHSNWSEASCTEPSRCLACGEGRGMPTGHNWLDADCESPQSCSLCGETKGEALGHKWTDATEEEAKTCTRCGKTEGEPLKPDFDKLLESVCDAIGDELDDAEFVYDEDVCILYVSIQAKKGTAESIVTKPSKIADYWEEVSELITKVSGEAYRSFRDAGYYVDCCIMLISDINEENYLLAAQNGEIFYSVLE